MNGVRVALDTNAAIRILNSEPAAVRRFRAEAWVALPMPVVGELLFGAANSGLSVENSTRYEGFVLDAHLLPVDLETARLYAETRLLLKTAGTPIPENDLWIAAVCLRYDLTLVTSDRHFRACPGLAVEDWSEASA